MYIGSRRAANTHFGKQTVFNKDRHVVTGSLALFILTFGMVGGAILVTRYLERPFLGSIHGKGAMVLLPFLLFGLFSGFYLYLNPSKRKIIPALHAINNIIVLILAILQLVTGVAFYITIASSF